MKNIDNLPTASKKLTEIMVNNDLFFRNSHKHITEYVDLTFEPYATITLKQNTHLTPEIVRELKINFDFKEN